MGVEVRMLGRFRVLVDGAAVPPEAWRLRAVQLSCLLALAPGCRLHREQVIDALWPDLTPAAGAANLHKAAHHVRRALGLPDAVVLRGGVVALCPDGAVTTDVGRFEAAAGDALAAGDPAACVAAADLHPGVLLPDRPYDEWTLAPRERLRLLHLELLRAAGAWERVVRLDPADEDAQLELVRARLAEGRTHAALRRFHRLRAALRSELGAEPGPRARAVYREITARLAAAPDRRGALVGREVELARLRAALRVPPPAGPVVVLVGGDEGVGKTRLCEELLPDAAADGWTVVRGAGWESGTGRPYAPLAEAVDRLLLVHAGEQSEEQSEEQPGERPGGEQSGEQLREQPRERFGERFGEALDEEDRAVLRRLAGDPDGGGVADAAPLPRHRVLTAFGHALAACAGRRGVLLFLDDLHTADDATLQLVHWLSHTSHLRLALLLGFRPAAAPPLLDSIRTDLTGRTGAQEVRLEPLGREETAELAGQAAGRALPPAATRAIWELTRGNPHLTEELAAAAASGGPVQVPPSLLDVLDRRLATLGPDLVEVLRRAALARGELDEAEFTALAGLDRGGALAALDAALAAGVLEVSGQAYRFRSPLARQALLRGLPPHRRAAVHAHAAAALAAAGGPAAAAAHHHLQAGHAGDALPWLLRAAEEAAAVAAHTDALRFVDRALAIAPGRSDLLAHRAELLFVAGDPTAPAVYGAAATASGGADADRLRLTQAWVLLAAGDVPGAAHALDVVGAVTAQLRVRHLLTTGMLAWFTGRMEDAAAAAEDAWPLALHAGVTRDLLDTALLRGMVAHVQGRFTTRLWLDVFDDRLVTDLAAVLSDPHLCVAESYVAGPEPASTMIAFATRLRDAAAGRGVAHAAAFATTLLGEAELLAGQLDAAEGHLHDGVRLSRRLGAAAGEALSLQRLAELTVATGRRQAAAPLLAQAVDAADGSPLSARHLLPRIYGTRIRAAAPETACAVADEAALAVVGPTAVCPFCSLAFLVPAAVAYARAGRQAPAHDLLDRAAGTAAVLRLDAGGQVAALAEARGHLAAAEGDPDAAGSRFAEAAAEFARSGQPLNAARCRAAAAAIPGA